MEEMRLQKFLAVAGIASRRKAEEMIKQGQVKVNGIQVFEMGIKVGEKDLVELDGRNIILEERKVYIMLNKPVGYVTTVKDQFGRAAVIDLLKAVKERVYPVGRLDYDTSGLLLLTNDGDFAYRITHPKHETSKVYVADIRGIPDEDDIKHLKSGVEIDGYLTAPAHIEVLNKKVNSSTVKITIHEGKNRQIRKMCGAVGHPVMTLKRVSIGKVLLGNLLEGEWRYLRQEEVKWLE